MNVRWLFLLGLLVVLGGQDVRAQSGADAFFHEAARQYVAGEEAAARRTVRRGLEVAPSDSRLLALQEKLQESASRQQGGGESGSSGQTGTNSDESTAGEQEQNGRSQPSPSESQSQPDEGGAPQRPRGAGEDAGGSDEREAEAVEPSDERRRARGREAPALSPAQARRLLQALESQEKQLLREIRVQNLEEHTVEKDW